MKVKFSVDEKAIPVEKRPIVPRIARMLALAHLVDRLIDEGKLADYADAARRLGVSRGRMTQVMNLRGLSPTIQEGILVSGWELSERVVRGIGGGGGMGGAITNNRSQRDGRRLL